MTGCGEAGEREDRDPEKLITGSVNEFKKGDAIHAKSLKTGDRKS